MQQTHAVLEKVDTYDLLFRITASGNIDLIRSLWFTTPHLSEDRFANLFALAVVAATTGEPGTSHHVQAARSASVIVHERHRKSAIKALDMLVRATGSHNVREVAEAMRGDNPLVDSPVTEENP